MCIHWLVNCCACVWLCVPPDQVDLYSPCRRVGKKNKTKQTFSNWISDADVLPYRNFGNKMLGRFFHSSALLYSKVMEQLIGLGVSSASLLFLYYRITFLTRTHFFPSDRDSTSKWRDCHFFYTDRGGGAPAYTRSNSKCILSSSLTKSPLLFTL